MKKITTILLALAIMMPCASLAQRKKKTVKKPKKEEVTEDPRITQMLSATQRVIFIDSMVVSKHDFMRYIPLSADCGKLEQVDGMGQYTNELRDHRLTTVFNNKDSVCQIMVSDYIGNEWSKPMLAEGFDGPSVNFPYMMPDGSTLYFAQTGEKSIGGYDIFVTRYDADSGTFLKAENIGMPFASEANDYLYAIDETNQLGYFVTDRRQPSGKVCIYAFIPSDSRRVYQTEAYSDSQIRSLARIDSISATWTDKKAVAEAKQRLKKAKKNVINGSQNGTSQTVATPLESLRHQADVLAKALQLSRNYYAKATESERVALRNEILNGEKDLERMQLEIKQKEKELRNEQYKQLP